MKKAYEKVVARAQMKYTWPRKKILDFIDYIFITQLNKVSQKLFESLDFERITCTALVPYQ